MVDAVQSAVSWINQRRGSGWRETHFENALAQQMRAQGLFVVQQPVVPATLCLSTGIEVQVGALRPDLLVRTSQNGVDIDQFYIEIKISSAQNRTANVTRAHMDQAEGYAAQTGIPCIAVFFNGDRTAGTHVAVPPHQAN